MNNIWKQVATSWRTVEKDSDSDVSIEELTDELMDEIQESGLLTNTYEFLDSEKDEDDEDDDWP
ncbi:hypothetical protein [Peribacillus frigoritolerans]|uniref:hypothetical protein n=1 Tax=Peribacillus frigoritolerans TaxID=450367 RepID=UPI002E1D86C5|nr:hypothetical protein [Peribacillus frigoritolerans]